MFARRIGTPEVALLKSRFPSQSGICSPDREEFDVLNPKHLDVLSITS
jgi:hypothetical protein